MGPEAVIAALITALTATWGTFIAAFFRGDLIPGHVYRREVKRADATENYAARTAQALEQLRREKGKSGSSDG